MAVFLSWLLGRRDLDRDSDHAGDRLALKALACAEASTALRMEIDLLMAGPSAVYQF